MIRIFSAMRRYPVEGFIRNQSSESFENVVKISDSSIRSMLERTSSFTPEQERMSENTNIPMFRDSINGTDLVMVKSEIIFEVSKDRFNFPSQSIPFDNYFRVKGEMACDKDMNFFGIFGIPFTNSNNDIVITFKVVDFGFEAVNQKRPFFTFGIGKSYLSIEFNRRDDFNEVICFSPFAFERDKSIRFSFRNPMLFFKIKEINQLRSEVPIVKDDITMRNIFSNNIVNKFISESNFGFEDFITRDTESIFFNEIRKEVNRIRFFVITVSRENDIMGISDDVFSAVVLISDTLKMLTPFFTTSIVNNNNTTRSGFSGRVIIKESQSMVIEGTRIPLSIGNKVLEILIMGVRDFVRDGRDISMFHFNKESGEIEAERNEQFFRKEMGEIIKKVLERDRARSYHLDHGDTSLWLEEREDKIIFFLPFWGYYNNNLEFNTRGINIFFNQMFSNN